VTAPAAPSVRPSAPRPSVQSGYDLESDEKLGGHTLRRHVGRTDEQLRTRLRQESDISAASTFTDRDTAARVVSEALRRNHSRLTDWKRGAGDKPNLSLRYQDSDVIGRSLSRRAEVPVDCRDANVVLMWKANRPVVLTAYPEPSRGR
jgi:toxin YxiD